MVAVATCAVLTLGWAAPALASNPEPVFGTVQSLGLTSSGTTIACVDATDCTAVGNACQGSVCTSFQTTPFYDVERAGTWEGRVVVGTTDDVLNDVSCSDANDCTAVGQEGSGRAIAITETGGTWGPLNVLPGVGNLYGVSCTAPGDCTAVGMDGNAPTYEVQTAGSWGLETELPNDEYGVFKSVSCTDATDCTAVGYDDYATETKGTWGPVTALPVAGNVSGYPELESVSCSTHLDCTAVGQGLVANPPYFARWAITVTEADGTWGTVTAPYSGQGAFDAVTCADAADCVAVGGNDTPDDNGDTFSTVGMYATMSSGSWSSATSLATGEMTGASCTALTTCTAVGFGVVLATVPGAPVIGEATVSHGHAEVSFTSPSYDGGEPITSYTVLKSSSLGYVVATTTCTATPCEVKGLGGGKSFTFEVEATSESGSGPPSAPSNKVSTPATVPGPPRIGKVTRGNASATVHWSAPLTNGGATVTGYTATAWHSNEALSCTTSKFSCTIRGLKSGKVYRVWVVAKNSVGRSPRSASRSVTPLR